MRWTGYQPWMRAVGAACLAGCLGGCGMEGIEWPAAPHAPRGPALRATAPEAATPRGPALARGPATSAAQDDSEPTGDTSVAAPAKPRRLSFPAPIPAPAAFDWAAVGPAGGGWTLPSQGTAATATPVTAEVPHVPPVDGPAIVAPSLAGPPTAVGLDIPPWESGPLVETTSPPPAAAPLVATAAPAPTGSVQFPAAEAAPTVTAPTTETALPAVVAAPLPRSSTLPEATPPPPPSVSTQISAAPTTRTAPPRPVLAPADEVAPLEVDTVALGCDEATRAVLRRAEAHNRQGVSLAMRGAIYSARAEFAAALNELVEARDRSLGGRQASAALGRALRALDEIRDLMPRDGQSASSIQLERLARSHQTPVLRGEDVSRLTPSAAVEVYGVYAEEQFGLACGREPAASVALHGLGKVHEFLAASTKADAAHAARLAEFYHRAALGVNPANHLAANDLAVLLARGGQYEQAQGWLLASVRTSPQPTTWRNLAVVHERLGRPDLALLARREEQALVRAAAAGDPTAGNIVPPYAVELVEPRVFAATTRPAYDVPPASASTAAATVAAAPGTATPTPAARPAEPPRKGFSWGGWFQ